MMKKNLFFYLFALVCALPLFTACSDDDDISQAESVAGDYSGTLDVSIAGVSLDTSTQTITVRRSTGSNTIDLTIKGLSIDGINLGNITLEGCQLSEGAGGYTFTGTDEVNLVGGITADVAGVGEFTSNGALQLDLDITNIVMGGTSLSYDVDVTFRGTKVE